MDKRKITLTKTLKEVEEKFLGQDFSGFINRILSILIISTKSTKAKMHIS
jgi:hypothetical protein